MTALQRPRGLEYESKRGLRHLPTGDFLVKSFYSIHKVSMRGWMGMSSMYNLVDGNRVTQVGEIDEESPETGKLWVADNSPVMDFGSGILVSPHPPPKIHQRSHRHAISNSEL